MGSSSNLFKRIEKKYLLSEEKYSQLISRLSGYIVPDEYPHNTICSMYYDTPDFRLIRASIEKPVYREKLRIRSYGVPEESTAVYVEVKKKYDGVVYKRRLKMELGELEAYLDKRKQPEHFLGQLRLAPDSDTAAAPWAEAADKKKKFTDMQIYHEIDYFLDHYGNLRPMMFLSYERDAFFARDNRDLRITFDSDITYRCSDLRLEKGVYGKKLIKPGQRLMEIKIPGAMPLWLSHILDELEIRSSGFTKYGNAYKQELTHGQAMKGVYVNA